MDPSSLSIERASKALTNEGNMLMRSVTGEFVAFGPATSAVKGDIELDASDIVTAEQYFAGPIQCHPRKREWQESFSIKGTLEAE